MVEGLLLLSRLLLPLTIITTAIIALVPIISPITLLLLLRLYGSVELRVSKACRVLGGNSMRHKCNWPRAWGVRTWVPTSLIVDMQSVSRGPYTQKAGSFC